MISAITPFTCPELFRSLLLGTTWSPGTATVTGHDRIEQWDVQAPKGSTGGTSKLNGRAIGRFTVSFYLAGDSDDEDGYNDFVRWDAFQKLLESLTSGPTPVTLPCYHPDIARNKFSEVSVSKIGGMTRDNLGGGTVVVEFIEYRPAKPKPAVKAQPKASGSSAGTAAKAKPDPNAQRKKELQTLLDEAKKP